MNFKDFLISPVDSISDEIIEINQEGILKEFLGCKKFVNCDNNNLISEASLSRLLDYAYNSNRDFAIITAYRAIFDKETNIKRNRKLRSTLNENKLGTYQLVGHWQECQLKEIPWQNCPKEHLKDVIERSYLVVKPDNMKLNVFYDLMVNLMTIDGEKQDGILFRYSENNEIGHNTGIYLVIGKNQEQKIGSKLNLGKIAQSYSQFVKKMNVPFVFEGLEIPGSNFGKMLFKIENVLWI